MIGLVLAGGNSTRLYPLNQVCTKQMLPIYDKPLIYYPLANLLLLGIREFVIIIKPYDKKNIIKLIGNGENYGIKISYIEQEKPNGIPEALILAEKYLRRKKIMMILGDNIFFGNTLTSTINSLIKRTKSKCNIFLHEVENPNAYGVALIDKKTNKILRIVEKPKKFVSKYVVTGLYVFDDSSVNLAKKLKKSERNEIEITDLINIYIKNKNIDYKILERGIFWIDAGTTNNILKASQIIELIQNRNQNKIACIEEICYEKKYISKLQYKKLINKIPKCEYREYLQKKII